MAVVKNDKALSSKTLALACDKLCSQEAAFAEIINQYGPILMWEREPGFITLLHIILEQQVSLESAQACLDKLLAARQNLKPQIFLELSDEELRSFGFSRQKIRYGRLLAERFMSDGKSFDDLAQMDDEDVLGFLTSLTGIGPWSAQVYLLMVLKRPDVWPFGDRALVVAAKETFGLKEEQTQEELKEFAKTWAPHRSVAARILWLGYLGRRGKLVEE